MKYKAMALCRVSTARQRIEGHSLEAQEINVYKAAEYWDADIDKFWSLDTSSKKGTNLARKDLVEALEYCTRNKTIKFFILDEVDRFMRSIEEYYWFKVEFKKRGVKLVFATQPELSEESQAAQLLEMLEVFRSESSNAERIKKTTEKMKARVVAGYHPFNCLTGYMKSSTPGLHIPDPRSFSLLQQAGREVASGIYTPSEALQRMNAKGSVFATGSKLKIDKFIARLRNEYYVGVVNKFGIRNENGLHTPMFTQAEFEAIQNALDGRLKRTFTRKQHNPLFPMNKLLLCGECSNGKFTGSNRSNRKNGKVFPTYRCRGCGKQYSKSDVNKAMDIMLSQVVLPEDVRHVFLPILKQVWTEKQHGKLAQIRGLIAQADTLRATKTDLVRSYSTADQSIKNDIKEEIENTKLRISELDTEVSKLSDMEEDLVDFVAFSLAFVAKMKDNWWSLKPNQRQRCQQMLFPGGIYFNSLKKVSTPQISTLFPLASQVSNKKEPDTASDSLLVELRGIAPRSGSLLSTHLQA